MNLKSKLLSALPVEERTACASVKHTVKATAYESGLEGLKNLIADRSKELSSFKYDSGSDRLYAYLKTKNAADQLFADATVSKSVFGKLAVKRSGPASVRFDNASKFAKSFSVLPENVTAGDWSTFAVDCKQIFRDIFGPINGVSVTYNAQGSKSTLYAYATSSRKLESEFMLAARMLTARAPDVIITTKGAYGVSAKFVFDPEKPYVAPVVENVTPQPAVNKLREGLAATAVVNHLTLEGIRDQLSVEVYEQFLRILEGERLPAAPLIARYRDAYGQPFTAFYEKSGQRVDIEALLLALRQNGKQMHTMSSDLSHVILGGSTIKKPALILMADAIDVEAIHVTVVAPGVNKQVKLFKQK